MCGKAVEVAFRVTATILGDAGGANARLDYQVAGLLGFRVTKKWVVQAGYRYLYVDYRPPSTFVYDVTQSGVIFGSVWSLKWLIVLTRTVAADLQPLRSMDLI